jgi:hypothetical protein
MKIYIASVLSVVLMAATAVGQPYNARGSFNGWGETPMNDDMDGSYSVTIGGLGAGARHNFKVAFNDWASSWPGSDARTAADGAGNINLHFYPGAFGDGWSPASDRVGYDDHGQFGWEIMGSFNGWDAGTDTAARQMTNVGGGLYSVDYTIASAGSYDFKFRESGSWDISVGGDFGNSAGNANITTTQNNQIVRFMLDLPNGRWTTIAIPEPATLLAATCGVVATALLARRRRR